jgi:Kef-type K+ transport system membrane component KefB
MGSLSELTLPIQDPVLIFGICMTAILVVPLLLERIRLPGIIGPILAGVLLGPSVLNVLERGQALELLGAVGLLYIMFLAGLEIDMGQFLKHRNRSLVFGSITFLIPQVLGTIIFRYLLGFDWAAAILIASMFASHTLVPYPIISRLGILKNNAVVTTVGGTIFTDTIALLILVVIARSVQGELNAMFWFSLTLSMIIYVAAILYFLPRLTRWFFRNVGDGGRSEFLFVVAIVFLCAFAAKAVGTEAILGAFLAGLTLNRSIPERSRLMSRIQFFGDTFVIPFFLLFIGLLVDVSVLLSGAQAWIVMIAMLSTNVGTKFIAAKLTQRIYNYTNPEMWVMFGLSTCEAAATLAAALIGYELNIIGDDVLNGVVLMIFATCVLGPSIVERFGREIAKQEQERPYEPREAPQRILVPLANPATSETLIDIAAMLRDRGSEEMVFPLTVVAERHDSNTESNVAGAERLLAHAVVHAAEINLPINPVTRVAANPASGIVDAATERRISDIVIGWNGVRSTPQRIFGGVIDQMLEQANQQILVCRLTHPISTVRRVVAILPALSDHNPGFYDAVRTLKHLTAQVGEELQVVVVDDDLDRYKHHFDAVKIDVKTNLIKTNWRELKGTLSTTITDTDLVILVSARQKTVAYTGELKRLPRELADLQLSFIVLYPSEREVTSYRPLKPHGLPEILAEERVLLDLATPSYEKTVEALLSTAIPKEDKRHWSVLKALVYDDVGYASEVLPGVIISHARVRELKETMMFLGTHPEGVRHEGSNQPIHVIVLLLSPDQVSTPDHLAQLSEVARYFSHAEDKDFATLAGYRSIEELRQWFNRRDAAAPGTSVQSF